MIRPFVGKLARHLDRPTTILDIGCGDGEIGLSLAELGHDVTGISIEVGDIASAKARLADISGLAGNCEFLEADARDIQAVLRGRKFGAILISDVLHLMSKTDAASVVDQAKSLTAANGLHLVRGYVVDPAQASTRNRARMFHPSELRRHYDGDEQWRVLDYLEDTFSVDNRLRVQSHASIIARSQMELALPGFDTSQY